MRRTTGSSKERSRRARESLGVSEPGIRERLSPNHDSRGEVIAGTPRIDTLVLHYTGMQSAAAALCIPV